MVSSASDFDYRLPAENIAQHPAEHRPDSRLLVDCGLSASGSSEVEHRTMADLPSLVGAGDVVVINDTKVIPARLRLRRETGGAAEVLLLEPRGDGSWEALVRPSKKLPPGTQLDVAPGFAVRIDDVLDGGKRLVTLETADSIEAALEASGELPLPPYITETVRDMARYQTVYATHPGSVAAPTAGLHLTTSGIEAMKARGAKVCRVQLTVGLDTFRPLNDGSLDDHEMHTEAYRVPADTWEAIAGATRVVAVGTTVVRALESAAARGELEGRTDLFIRPPFAFQVVDALLTNFHLPKSTLLVMIEAFIGPRWRELYALAIDDGYAMLSFGDGMFLTRQHH